MEHFLTLVFMTFALEDAALALSVVWVGHGSITFFSAFMACFLGISIGDIALYILGRWVASIDFNKPVTDVKSNQTYYFRLKNLVLKKFSFLKKLNSFKPDKKTEAFISYSVVISRFIPGTRIPAYVGAGLLKYSFLKFFILTLLSVAVWVLLVLLGGNSLYNFFKGNLVFALLGFFILLMIAKSLFPKLMDYWQRRALIYSFLKWTRFEFWPPWLFYAPVVPLYIYRSLKGGSFILPFYSNPQILNSGLMGESKWDFLIHLKQNDPTTLKSKLLGINLSLEERKNYIIEENFRYPFILKPDVGQRGYGVRIIRSYQELDEYLKETEKLPLVLQALSHFPMEAGIFYYRKPSEVKGHLFSITDKKFPAVVGDGKTRLGDLILNDKRARIIAPVYFQRLKNRNFDSTFIAKPYGLNEMIQKNESIQISECGNHCQGAIFENGENLKSETLLNRIDQIAKTIPDFYFGRFDIRYLNPEKLKMGLDFEIVEINGAGSEATHIWDKNTSLVEAYKVLWQQWKLLFDIGYEIKQEILLKKRIKKNVHVWQFLKEVGRVVFRKDHISISS